MPEVQIIPTRSFTLEASCHFEAVREACRRSRDFLAGAGLNADELDAWELVLAEAGNNAVRYASDAARPQPIRFELRATAAMVEARVFDHTDGFDFPEQTELPPAESEHGRGLFLIQTLTDEALYWRGHHENCLVLRRQRHALARVPDSGKQTSSDLQAKLDESQQTLELMTEELASCFESLSAIFRFSAELADQGRPEESARKWLGELQSTARADWFVLRLATEDGASLRLAASSQPALPANALPLDATSAAVEVRAALTRSDVWFDAVHPVASDDPLARPALTGSGFVHPIVVRDSLVGVLTLGCRDGQATFKAAQVNIIQTFAEFLGIQLRSAQFHEEQVRHRLTTRELEIAAEIQRSLLPVRLPEPIGFRLAGHYRSARRVGGDFYDALVTADGGVLLAIADVMGKGVAAAMFAAIFRSQLRAGVSQVVSPAALLEWMNLALFADLDRVEMFITARLVYLDPVRREIRVAAAGHPPLLIAGADGTVQEIEATGLPLGIRSGSTYAETVIPLPAGSRLLLFTDGLTEARNKAGEFLGTSPLKDWLGRAAHESITAEASRDALATLLTTYQEGVTPGDDETFLLLAETPAAPDRS